MAKFPGDLESSYSGVFAKLIESINKQYIIELRKALKEEKIEEAKSRESLKVNQSSYQKLLARLKKIREKLFSKNLFKQTLESMNNVMDRLAGGIEKNIKGEFKKAKFPIPQLSLKADSAELNTAISRNVALISKITEDQSKELEKAVLRSVQGGSDTAGIIKEVERISDEGRNYAEFVARDQIAKAHGAINKDMQTKSGFPGYIWRITNDARVRDDHKEQAGKYFLWTEPPLLDNGNLHPGEDFQCRCIAEPAFFPE